MVVWPNPCNTQASLMYPPVLHCTEPLHLLSYITPAKHLMPLYSYLVKLCPYKFIQPLIVEVHLAVLFVDC